MTNTSAKMSFLEFMPVSLFGAILGLAGLSFSWEWAARTWGFDRWIKNLFAGLALVFFLLLCLAYLLKFIRYPALVKAEWAHPVSVSFFGTFIISLLLLPGILLPYSVSLATAVWSAGALLIFAFSWMVLRRWFDHQQDRANAEPAWLIPVVGTLDVPIVGYRLPVPGIQEICLFFFAIGIIFALILLTIIISRLLFQPPLPAPLQPTLLILVGPFALAFSDYETITGSQDIVAGIFYYFDLFLLLVLGSKLLLLPNCCPFRVSWWAVSFPLVAITIASFRYAAHRHSSVYQFVPAVLLTVSTLTIVYLLGQTFYKIITGKLFLKPAAEKATRMLEPLAA